MKKKDISLTPTDLHLQITKAVMDLKLHKLKNTNLIKNLRRDLARALTYAKV